VALLALVIPPFLRWRGKGAVLTQIAGDTD
jgi:hypothetical protein